MKKIITTIAVASLLSSAVVFAAQQSSVVQADIDAFQGYFKKKFPNLSFNDFVQLLGSQNDMATIRL